MRIELDELIWQYEVWLEQEKEMRENLLRRDCAQDVFGGVKICDSYRDRMIAINQHDVRISAVERFLSDLRKLQLSEKEL